MLDDEQRDGPQLMYLLPSGSAWMQRHPRLSPSPVDQIAGTCAMSLVAHRGMAFWRALGRLCTGKNKVSLANASFPAQANWYPPARAGRWSSSHMPGVAHTFSRNLVAPWFGAVPG